MRLNFNKRGVYMYKLGVDVGGTHIDFAVVDHADTLLYGCKVLSDDSFQNCFARGIQNLKRKNGFNPAHVSGIHLGTTLAVNSLLELKSLYKVGVIRLASHAPELPPAYRWPTVHRNHILAGFQTVAGGREYNNEALSAFDSAELIAAVKNLIQQGAESLAIIGVFSPFYAEDEIAAQAVICQHFGDIPVSLSHKVGSLGFIERENTTILNATLKKVMFEGFCTLQESANQLGFDCDCYITQNNGTLLTLSEAIEFPVRTISSGPTNSIIGACRLANCTDGLVVDVGGTSTDIGIIQNGLPLYSLNGGLMADIPCQLVTPDVVALAMGGGSIIRQTREAYKIGPDSLGSLLFKMCKTAGGAELTLYDVGQVLMSPEINIGINQSEAEKIMRIYLQLIRDEINRMLPNSTNVPILLVGGGSRNIPDEMLDEQFVRPPNYDIANAYGAALSQIAGHIDRIIDFKQESDFELKALEEEAKTLAVSKGAISSRLKIIEKKVLPLHYMPEPRYRVLITVAGPIG